MRRCPARAGTWRDVPEAEFFVTKIPDPCGLSYAALPVTPPARLTAMTTRLDTMLQSVKSVRGALDDFYNSLTDEQKAQFDLIGRQQSAQK
jgi:hypothetical protein